MHVLVHSFVWLYLISANFANCIKIFFLDFSPPDFRFILLAYYNIFNGGMQFHTRIILQNITVETLLL
jgi:hypothetical protein